MGIKTLNRIEREFGMSWTENLSINTDDSNPHHSEVRDMVRNRNLSLSLRRQLNIN